MTSSVSDEIAAKLAGPVLAAWQRAREHYYAGEEGPYVLEGDWTQAEGEAFLNTLEGKWHVGWEGSKLVLFGDPGRTHESVGFCLITWIQSMPWQDHSDTPVVLRNPMNMWKLYQDFRSSDFKWRLTPRSLTSVTKQPDAYFRATSALAENGLAIEVAHHNEPFDKLVREVVDWTCGEGQRALVAVGLKIDSKSPHHQDPRLRLVVRDVTPTSQCINCRVYEFGAGSGVEARESVAEGPATAVETKEVRILLEDGIATLEAMSPVDKTDGTLMVDIPVGAAMFHDIQPHSVPGLQLSSAFIINIQQQVWKVDLNYLRWRITNILNQ